MSEKLPAVLEEGMDQLATWSDSRRNDFCKVFEKRTRFALCVVTATARALFKEAMARYFVPYGTEMPKFPLENAVGTDITWVGNRIDEITVTVGGFYHGNTTQFTTWCGRSLEELTTVVKERVLTLLMELPASLDVVRVIKPEIATKIVERDRLEKRCTALKEEINELIQPVDISQADRSLTIGQFLDELKARQQTKVRRVRSFGQCSQQVSELREEINKSLYKGVPELAKATMATIEDLRQKALGLSKLERNVTDTVKFGDSEAAMTALKQFEKDEIELAPAIEARFKGIVGTLRNKYKLTAGKRGKVTKKKTTSKKKATRKKKSRSS